MPEQPATASPGALARLCGALYLITIALGLYRELYVRGRIVVPGDVSATAANLRSMEALWRSGVAAELVMVLCTIVIALLLYLLLRPAGGELALLMTFFNLVAISVEAAFSIQLVQALFPMGRAASLRAFTAEQLDAMTSLALKSHAQGFGIALLFFGPFFLIAGRLIFRSGYFPRIIGVLYQIAGVGYLVNGFCQILAPAVASTIFAVVAIPVFVGEASFCAWLLLKGVDLERWKVRVGAAPMRAATAAILVLAIALPMSAQPADAVVVEAKRLLDTNRPESAVKLLEKAVAENPKSALRHYWLGRAYGATAGNANAFRMMSLARNARDAFERSVNEDPNFVDARMALVEFYLMAPGVMGGSVDKAREQAMEIRKRDALEGHRAFAKIAAKSDDTGSARTELLAAIRENPGSPKPRYFYGVHLMVDEKNYGAAAEQFNAALGVDAGFLPAYFQIGHVAALSGTNLAAGEEALRRYLTARPADDDPPLHRAHYWLGKIFEKAGRKGEARAQYEAALRLRPGDKSVKEALKRVS
ncbi:MAG: DUF4386 family protein [Acidobacteria bacterium]|nr:DUF4386 family protein [Acidobacteriota bacterium]